MNENCGKFHNELQDYLSPFKHYDTNIIGDVVDEIITADDSKTENYPCEDTMNHWEFWVKLKETNIDGQEPQMCQKTIFLIKWKSVQAVVVFILSLESMHMGTICAC